jgi:hypothetical protein
VSVRTLSTLVANALAWAWLLTSWWDVELSPAAIALVAIHVVYPLFAASRATPLLVAAVDATALYIGFRLGIWDPWTIVIVAFYGALALLALAYAAVVVTLLHRRSKKQP